MTEAWVMTIDGKIQFKTTCPFRSPVEDTVARLRVVGGGGNIQTVKVHILTEEEFGQATKTIGDQLIEIAELKTQLRAAKETK